TPPPVPRKNNNIPSKDLINHTRNIADNHILICAKCNDVLQEKLWALGCGHVICGRCSTEFSGKKKVPCPSCQTKSRPSSMLQLYV
ncbi:2131_t:CDS:1, partial [Acaulospora morrowiae]